MEKFVDNCYDNINYWYGDKLYFFVVLDYIQLINDYDY